MALSEKSEELLETLWVELVEGGKSTADGSVLRHDEDVQRLVQDGYLHAEHSRLSLTARGQEEGRNCVRRHRLAERLMHDVLHFKGTALHDTSCKFEHLLHRGLDENICTLLGHPTECPHGRPIPPGECCKRAASVADRVILPVSDLRARQSATVSHLQTNDRETLQRLILIGALPGTHLRVVQRFPTFVLRIGQSEFAIDRELASRIYVRRGKAEAQD